MKNRIIAIIMCITLLLPELSNIVHADTNIGLKILHNNDVVNEITLAQNEKETLEVDTDIKGEYQWQLSVGNQKDQWANIYDKTDKVCELSYAMVKNSLDVSGSTYIRCKIMKDDTEYVSKPVCITVSFVEETEEGLAKKQEKKAVTSTYRQRKAAPLAEEKEYVTITIKYLDYASLTGGVESSIYSSYVATLEKGTAFKQEVISPTFLGFAPFWDDSDTDLEVNNDASIIELDYPSVTENITLNVYYKPVEVDFGIRYFFQNINDDMYTENAALFYKGKAETGTIIADAVLKEHAGDTIGFEKLYHYPESIAADGSTVFECYYDRNYYLIQFDMAGGYGVEPVYARYGASFLVNAPLRPGYSFKGWDKLEDTNGDGIGDTGDGNVEDNFISTIPAQNCYYRAVWETVNTTATIVYWLQNPNNEETYDYWGSREINVKSGVEIDGETYKDYSAIAGELDEEEKRYSVYAKADTDVLVNGDGSTVVNVYYDRKEYTLKFYYSAEYEEGEETKHVIVGGSTYYFGEESGPTDSTYDNGDEVDLLDYMRSRADQWGLVHNKPTVKNEDIASKYEFGSTLSKRYTSNNLKYNYISFTAKYGADISHLWPCDVFNSVERTSGNTHGNWSGTTAYVSAWNGEHHVRYSQEEANETIKGNYQKLDEKLLFHSDFEDSTEVAYLCFWENGANIGWSIPELYVYNIYVPILDGENTENLTLRTYNGVTYKQIDSYNTCDNSNVNEQTQPSLDGYSAVKYIGNDNNKFDSSTRKVAEGEDYSEAWDVYFYYSRNSYTLNFYNYNQELKDKEKEVPFETQLDDYYFEPSYPKDLEENAYRFVGWYTSPGCFAGSEFGTFQYDDDGNYVSSSFDGYKMPSHDITLYAKWVPITHTVNFFTTYDEMKEYENDMSTDGVSSVNIHYTTSREHGKVIGNEVTAPVHTGTGSLNLIFTGWFYMSEGKKKAFTPLDMPINRDLNIFADWNSNAPQPYRIQYVLQSDHSVKVADDTVGFAYGGSTRTFTAKAGNPFNQLYEQYNTGYYPTLGTHSITMQYENDKNNPVNNVFTFEYVQARNISYKVKYVNKETNVVMDEKTFTTGNAVVTERFKAYENMVPDAFYKRLVLSVEYDEDKKEWVGSDENEIVFYYSPNKTSAYYAVHYMMEKADATDISKDHYYIDGSGGYEESQAYTEGVGDLNETISITPQNFVGFEMITSYAWTTVGGKDPSNASYNNGNYDITIKAEGTELYIFYRRKSYDYKVNYYIYNTTTTVPGANPEYKTGTGRYGQVVTESAQNIEGYSCVSDVTQNMIIRSDVNQNVITFYYTPLQYTVEYITVPEKGGVLSKTIEVVTGETPFEGSEPTANKYFNFVGWFLDEEGTVEVGDLAQINEDNLLLPVKDKLNKNVTNRFYAKFERKKGNLTIEKTNANDSTQIFVYEVTNKETKESIFVTIKGNNSVTLYDMDLGEYTVVQKNDWSWRYGDSNKEVKHDNMKGTTVTFSGDQQNNYWVDGNSPLIRNVKGGGSNE